MITAGHDWYDDSDYDDAVHRAEQAARTGWAGIAGIVEGLSCALIAVVVIGVGVFVAGFYVFMAANR